MNEPNIEDLFTQAKEEIRLEKADKPRNRSKRAQAPASQSIAAGWKARLIVGKKGGALGVVANALIALRHAPEWRDVLHFNESSLATIAKLRGTAESR